MTKPPGARACALLALALVAALAVGCGDDTSDVSEAVAELNAQLQPLGVTAQCPDEVENGVGATFQCTLESDDGERSETVQLQIERENDQDVIAPANEQRFTTALERVAGAEGG